MLLNAGRSFFAGRKLDFDIIRLYVAFSAFTTSTMVDQQTFEVGATLVPHIVASLENVNVPAFASLFLAVDFTAIKREYNIII
jgi:hypothetical protein